MSKNKRFNPVDGMIAAHRYGANNRGRGTSDRTQLLENMHIKNLTLLAANRFKWTGLPEEIDVRFMEMTLLRHGLSVFFKDERYDKFFALQGGGIMHQNFHENPVAFQVIGAGVGYTSLQVSATGETVNRQTGTVIAGQAVPIWSNYMRLPDTDIIYIYAHKLAVLDRTIEINSKNARQTKFITFNENSRLSVENINAQMDEGYSVIKVADNMADLSFVQSLDLGINVKDITELSVLRKRLHSECMDLLGIDNANQDKKERLVAAEVDANNDQTSMNRYVNLNARRIAAEQINKIYNRNITVDYWTDEERQTVAEDSETVSEDTD